jgi:DNA-binding NtrC family response regulator
MESFIIPLLLIQYAMNGKEHIKNINDSHVFIVEDNDMHSLMMDYLLSKETTAHIKKFSSGEECIENLKLNPDVVILDYGLPGINGMQTLKAIKEHDPEIPVIVITGNKDKEVARSFFNAGVYDYIEKEEDAFEQVSKVTDSILNIMARKEAKKEHKQSVVFITGILLIATIITVIAYILMEH